MSVGSVDGSVIKVTAYGLNRRGSVPDSGISSLPIQKTDSLLSSSSPNTLYPEGKTAQYEADHYPPLWSKLEIRGDLTFCPLKDYVFIGGSKSCPFA
jgi:hypothetical protein